MGKIFLFFGDDTYSLNEKLNFWKEEFVKKQGNNMNLEVLDGTAIDGNQIESAISSAPFLGDKRLVIIKNYLSANKVNEEGQ